MRWSRIASPRPVSRGIVCTQVGALLLAMLLSLATSGGEANDEEAQPGGNTGDEVSMGDDPVDFTDVTEPTTVVVGGSEFVLTADGAYVLAVRATWYGGGDVTPELKERQLVALDTRTGTVTAELDLRDAGDFGVVLLEDPGTFVLVRRDEDGQITGLEGIRLPSMTVQWSYVPQATANTVRLSPSGRYAAFWTEDRLGWAPWNLELSVHPLEISVEDRLGQDPPVFFRTPNGVGEVIAAPDSSAFFVALSHRSYDPEPPVFSMEISRVDLVPGLPRVTLALPDAGHAADVEIKGGSALRLSPDGTQLVFSGCRFTSGTCNARWYVVDTATLQLQGDLRAASGAAFAPARDLAVGWDGESSSNGKIWITDCISESDPPDYVDHWLVLVSLDSLDSTVVDLPKLAPYYFVTRDSDYVVASVENCQQEELWAVSLETDEATPIQYGTHALHEFVVLDDNRTIYSVDRGILERIDLATFRSEHAPFTPWVSRINRLPGDQRLVLAGPELLTFTLWDIPHGQSVWQVSLDGSAGTPAPVPPELEDEPSAWRVPRSRAIRRYWPSAPLRRGVRPRLQRPRVAGGDRGVEIRL